MSIRSGMQPLVDRLRSAIGDAGTTPAVYSAWQASHAYVLGDYRRPTVANGHFYRVTVAGTSGASQPTFPTDYGSVIDGTVVWSDQGAIPAGVAVFTDEDLQAALDERRINVSVAPLFADPVLSGNPTVFRAPYGFWEDDSVVASGDGPVTADGALTDPLMGVWAFTVAPGMSLYLTGSAYDLWGSAANLLEEWAARTALEFDFGTDQQTFNRSDKRKSLLAVAREFGRRALMPRGRGLGNW